MGKGQKHDSGKPDLSLVPQVAMEQMCLAFMVGEKKYGRWNYCGGMENGRLVGAALRHIMAWYRGEEYDQESSELAGQNVSHLGCALANLAMLLRTQQLGTMIDNRFEEPQAEVKEFKPIVPRRDVSDGGE